jgi:hypothetical protein
MHIPDIVFVRLHCAAAAAAAAVINFTIASFLCGPKMGVYLSSISQRSDTVSIQNIEDVS